MLIEAIRDGAKSLAWSQDGFAYADRYDADAKRYRGLIGGQLAMVALNPETVVVKPTVAQIQIAADQAPPPAPSNGTDPVDIPPVPSGDGSGSGTVVISPKPVPSTATKPKRFFGSVAVNPQRLALDAATIAKELVAHLTALPGASAEIQLDITIRVPGGVPDNVVRTVTENARTLKFTSADFDAE